MIRVLHCVNNMHRAGIETMLMNYYRNIDRTWVQFDFLTHRPEKGDYDDEIIGLGGRVFYAPRLYPQNYSTYFKYMKQFYLEHPEYQIVHSHIDAMSYLTLLAAQNSGIPIRIAHSHNTSIDRDFKYPLKQFFRYNINSVSTHRLACSDEAGHFLFRGEPYEIMYNAIDYRKFQYDETIRHHYRDTLGLSERTLAIGHVGRLSYQKNQELLLEIYAEIAKEHKDSVLLLIGKGELERKLKDYCAILNIEDKVRFLGSCEDVNNYYQAMDAFVLPSRFEGLGIVGVEAQTADLPCFFSDQVPKEVAMSDNAHFMSLKANPREWAEIILTTTKNSKNRTAQTLKPEYDIKIASEKLITYYENLQL